MAAPQETLHFLDYWRIIRARKEIVLAVFLLVALTGILFTLAMPKVYRASCVIQVKEENPDLPIFEDKRWSFDPLFLRTQFQIIQSKPVIEEVVRRQGLDRTLSEIYGFGGMPAEEVLQRVSKIVADDLRVQQYRDTNLIEVQISFSEPKGRAHLEAARTANMVADVFREQNMARSREMTEAAMNALKESLEEQKQRVNEVTRRLEQIRQRYSITVLSSKRGSESGLERHIIARLEEERVRIRMELEDKRARFEKVMSLSQDELAEAAPYVVGDPALAALIQSKRTSEVKLSEMLMASLGPNHPEVVSVKAIIRELTAKIGDALSGVRAGTKHDYETARAKYVALEAMIEEKKASEIQAEAGGYQEFDKAMEDLAHARRIRDALEMKYLQEEIQLEIPRTTVEIIEPAVPSSESDYVSPNEVLNIILSVMVALCAAVGLAYFVEYIDTSVKTIDDVERFMDIPVVGVIPQKVEAFTDPRSYRDHAEAYRMLRTNIRFSEKMKGGNTLCVTSGSMAEGKSLTVFNLGCVCAQLGDRVIIVDSDMHRPRQHKIMGVDNTPGLANLLVGEATLDDALIHTDVTNLDFLPSGKLASGIHGLLDSNLMKELTTELSSRYDLVIFDAPPIIGVSDASLLVRETDGVLLVVQHRKYPRSVSIRAKSMVESAGGNLLGVVLNRINISKDYSYYYQYSYRYEHPRQEGPVHVKKS
ncbi:MAG: polysaccharide biosynthesis tyrosine autokinase [Verrucomicrobia bacterium]|nr:polysaccharide biosynthesis tyrosine autokinase [Verrucomicrobiota bacterium]